MTMHVGPPAPQLLTAFVSKKFDRYELAVSSWAGCLEAADGAATLPLLGLHGTTSEPGRSEVIGSAMGHYDLSAFDGLLVAARGDGATYRLRVSTAQCFAGVSYAVDLPVEPGKVQRRVLPFDRLRPFLAQRWQPFEGHPLFDAAEITWFGLEVHQRAPGPFHLEVFALEGHLGAEDSPARVVGGLEAASAWEMWVETVLYPMVLDAAGLALSTAPEAVFALPRSRAPCLGWCYDKALLKCDDIVAVAAAREAGRYVRSRACAMLREAVLHVVLEAAYELALAEDVWSYAPPDGSVTEGERGREARAHEALLRFRRLDSDLVESLEWSDLSLGTGHS